MKIHTTHYTNTFICVAEDCPAVNAETPPEKGEQKTIANLQFEMLHKNPYQFTSDEVLFQVYADKNGLVESEYNEARLHFFSKGQPCLRTSPLMKRYGWGAHFNMDGKIALVGVESDAYEGFVSDKSLVVIRAMKSKR